MILFSRKMKLLGGTGGAGLEWAAAVCGKVKEVSGTDLQLWGNVYSPGFGTITFTAWFEDLAALEAVGDQLQADTGYLLLTDRGADLGEGWADDQIYTPLHGEMNPERQATYVTAVEAVPAAGNVQRAMGLGVEIAQMAEKITGLPTMFGSRLTGDYGGVGWLTGYVNIGELQAAQEAMAGNGEWLELVDSTEGAFNDTAALASQTVYRRLV